MNTLKTTVDGMEVTLTATSKELMRVGRLWKRNAQGKLRREDKNATGSLTRSMKIRLDLDPLGNPYVDLTPANDYWVFVDGGVRGAVSSPFGPRQGENPSGGQPFQYRDKPPPVGVILSWMKVRGIKPRGEGGKFKKMTHKSLAFAIAESIRKRGIKPTHFITDTGDRIQSKYAASLAVAFAEDIAEALRENMSDGNND